MEKHQITTAFFTVDFGKIHYVYAGPEDGPCMILLHGFPEFWYGWRNQINTFADAGYFVVAPDQRGYNLTDKPKGVENYGIDLLAGDILALIKHLGRETVYLVGHDWGAAVAWHFAEKHQECLQKLVILNVPHPHVMSTTLRRSVKQLRKSWYILFFQLPWLPEFLLRVNHHRNAARMLQASRSPGRFSNDEMGVYYEAWSQPGAWTAMINWYRGALRHRAQSDTKKTIRVPTLVIWGKQDVALSQEMAQPSVDLCEDGRLVFIENATHWVQHDETERVNRLILEFLKTGTENNTEPKNSK